MFEYHGWATLRDANELCDPSVGDSLRAETLEAVRAMVETLELQGDSQRCVITPENGSWHLHLWGRRNHRQPAVEAFWQRLAEIAQASYGLLYIHNDEDPDVGNAWSAWPLRRGATSPEPDSFLSPVVPMINDPEPWEDRDT